MITYEYDLDMTPGDTPLTIHLNQNDANFALRFHLFSDVGELVIESGTSVALWGTKPGGGSFQTSGSISGTTVNITGNSQLTNVCGMGDYELRLTHAGKTLHSANFHICVEKIPQ